jgi:uncharacterized protein (TIGR02996 family)
MNEREALLHAVCENPDDDAPRLVFADWLQENGEDDRAEFIRLQIETAGLPDGKKKQNRQAREKELLDRHKDEWSEPLKPYFAYYYSGIYAHHYAPPVTFQRGFVETIAMDVNTFIARGAEAFALAPIRGLRLQDAQSLDNLAGSKDLLRLHALNLRGAVLSADGSDAPVLFRSKYLANLTTLLAPGYDDNGQLDVDGLRALAGTKHLKSLTRLDISDNWLFGGFNSKTSEAACRKLLLKLGENMPALCELRLHGMGLGDGEVGDLVGQKWVNRLRVLDLSGNRISETGCRALCKSKYLTRLERLDVADNESRDEESGAYGPLDPASRRRLKARFGKRVVFDSKRK